MQHHLNDSYRKWLGIKLSWFFFQEKTRLSDELQQLDLQLKQLPASTHTMKAMLEAKVQLTANCM